jgi:protein-tyrosine phosphatase
MTATTEPTASAISIVRLDPNRIRIAWDRATAGNSISVFMGPTPESIDRTTPVGSTAGDGTVTVSGLRANARCYFEVVSEGITPVIVAERRLPLEGAVNMRDLGGYRCDGGRRMRWGRLYRSDGLARLTPADLAAVEEMDLKLICDLRTRPEAAQAPDRLPHGSASGYLALPVVLGRLSPRDAFNRIENGDVGWLTEDFMRDGYRRALESHAREWGLLFERLADPAQLPALFHCSAGKDRTGIFAALVLLAMGVSEATVIHDHQLSNGYIADFQKRIRKRIRSFGVDPDRLMPYLTAPPDAIASLIAHIGDRYGDAAGYLNHRCGVGPDVIARVRYQLVE